MTLPPKVQEILQLLIQGYNKKEIADLLKLSIFTVKNYIYGYHKNDKCIGIFPIIKQILIDETPNPLTRYEYDSIIGKICLDTITGIIIASALKGIWRFQSEHLFANPYEIAGLSEDVREQFLTVTHSKDAYMKWQMADTQIAQTL